MEANMDMTDTELRAILRDVRDTDPDWVSSRTTPSKVLPKRYLRASVDDFPSIDTASMIENMRRGEGMVVYGPPGTGKTHLAAALVTRMHELGISDRPGWANTATLFDTMRRSFNDSSVKVPDFSRADLMVFEDIGRERPSPFVIEQMYVLINRAYEASIPVIVTTNIHPNDLGGFVGNQGFDRIKEMCPLLVHLNGPSRRGGW